MLFEPLRQILVRLRDMAHFLLGVCVLEGICLRRDFFGARSQLAGMQQEL